MAGPTIKFVLKENSDGSRMIIESQEFFECKSPYTKRWNTRNNERFHEERVNIEKGELTYLCGGCRKPLVLRGGFNEGGVTMYFRHKYDAPTDCPFEEERGLSEENIRALKYKGAQESPLHERLKLFIASCLEEEGYDTSVEQIVRINEKQRRYPDVLGKNHTSGRSIVFEIQMSTTFLHVIVDRMRDYASVGQPVIWVFHEFEPRVYTTMDTSQFQNNNVFVLNEEMIERSKQDKRLTLCTYYLKYRDDGNSSPMSEWKNAIVTLDDLTFDYHKGVYFFDSKRNREEIEAQINARERIEECIENGLSKIRSLRRLEESEIEALCVNYNKREEQIREAMRCGLYVSTTPYNLIALFQWLEILQSQEKTMLYRDIFLVLRYKLGTFRENIEITEWPTFNIISHPAIIEDMPFLFMIYHAGYRPSEIEAKKIKDVMMKEYKAAPFIEKVVNKESSKSLWVALTHFYLIKISKEIPNIKERTELISFYQENLSFISCVLTIAMKKRVEHDFSNYIGVCNHVYNHYKDKCIVILHVIEKSSINPKEFVSSKGVDHYKRIKDIAQRQIIQDKMNRLLSILIPKIWKS